MFPGTQCSLRRAKRKSCYGSSPAIMNTAKFLFYKWNDRFCQLFIKIPRKKDRVFLRFKSISTAHYNKHFPAFSCIQQIIHDKLHSPLPYPASLILSNTMLQIQHRIIPVSVSVISWWCIHIAFLDMLIYS